MIGSRVGLMAVAGALALPMSLLQAGRGLSGDQPWCRCRRRRRRGRPAGQRPAGAPRPQRQLHRGRPTRSNSSTPAWRRPTSPWSSRGSAARAARSRSSAVGGSQPPACSPLRWSAVKADEHVVLRCNTNALESATVHVSFTRAKQPIGSFAYALRQPAGDHSRTSRTAPTSSPLPASG